MMKTAACRQGAILVFFIAVTAGAAAGDSFSIQARGAYFIPSEAVFKEIYGESPVYGGGISLKIMGGLSLWAGGSFFNKTGTLTFTEESTTMTLIPVFGGLQYQFLSGRFRPYIGAGAGYILYKEENPIGKVEDGGLGFMGLAGVKVLIAGPLFLDLQGSYSMCKVEPAGIEADLGGIHIGLGLGLQFLP
ncbi:MAG: hypothetical protein SCM96_08790 [Acidobacteriota bacterium]|nr:hypothetical protein [Acidobacteriota bacterium]